VNRDNVFGVKSGGLAYEPNYSQIFERNNISVLDMSKITSRLPVKKMVYTLNEQLLDNSQYELQEGKS
jgi:hypothetical protein